MYLEGLERSPSEWAQQPIDVAFVVTSTPQRASDTYGARENIEFSVAFNQPVTVTGAPTFSFLLGSTNKTATWYAGSGTDTLLFSYAVVGGTDGDLDTDGIFWLSGSLGNALGIVRAHGTARPSLTYASQRALTDHKVDGRTAPAATAKRSNRSSPKTSY